MATENRSFPSQLATVFKRLSIGRKISLLVLVGAVIAGCVMIMAWASRPDYGVLYSDLEPEDAGAILASLKEQKMPYQIHSNGRSIMVPREKIHETRLELASRGLPQGSAVGFELFDNTKLGMTQFAQNVNYQRAMQGELARTINGFAEVESSRVHLVMQDKSLFVADEKPATASVVLKLRPGKWLTQNQVDGIVHLVSSSILGLSPENVTVVDHTGKVLSGYTDQTGVKQAGAYQLEYRSKIERNLEDRITTMLEKALGPGKAMARVSCTINFKKHEKTEELYYPENQVIRSEKLFSTSTETTEKNPLGKPGINAKFSADPAAAGNETEQGAFQKRDRTVNYEIGKVTSHIVEPFGTVDKVSVAVIVDGTYEIREDEKGRPQDPVYVQRTAEEMTKLENIVKSAINYDKQRGDQISVVNLPFESTLIGRAETEQQNVGWMSRVQGWLFPAIKYIFAAVVAMLVYFMILRPVVQWVTATDVSDAQLLQQLPKTVGELEREYNQGVLGLPAGGQDAGMISGNSEKAVQLLRGWMSQS